MSLIHKRGPARIEPSMTPLVDVVFLLIVFFVLVAQITSAERFEMTLPNLADAPTSPPPREHRLIVNVIPERDARRAQGDIRVGALSLEESPQGMARLAEIVQEARRRDPQLRISLRAARDERHVRIEPVMRALASTGALEIDLIVEGVGAPSP